MYTHTHTHTPAHTHTHMHMHMHTHTHTHTHMHTYMHAGVRDNHCAQAVRDAVPFQEYLDQQHYLRWVARSVPDNSVNTLPAENLQYDTGGLLRPS